MSPSPVTCSENADIEEAARLMEDNKIRRILATGDNQEVVGVLSLGDLAEHARQGLSGEVIKEVSTPSEPDR